MSSFLINTARAMLFGVVAVSAIVSLYAATNAVSVYSDHGTFVGGLMMVVASIVINPLFCFIATYGMVRYLDVPMWEAVAITAPACLAWCVAATRTLIGVATR